MVSSPAEKAALMAESLSELLNCGIHVMREPAPAPQLLEVLSRAVDRLLELWSSGGGVQGPQNVQTPSVVAILEQLRDALRSGERERLAPLLRELFEAMGIPALPDP